MRAGSRELEEAELRLALLLMLVLLTNNAEVEEDEGNGRMLVGLLVVGWLVGWEDEWAGGRQAAAVAADCACAQYDQT